MSNAIAYKVQDEGYITMDELNRRFDAIGEILQGMRIVCECVVSDKYTSHESAGIMRVLLASLVGVEREMNHIFPELPTSTRFGTEN